MVFIVLSNGVPAALQPMPGAEGPVLAADAEEVAVFGDAEAAFAAIGRTVVWRSQNSAPMGVYSVVRGRTNG